MGTVLPKTTPKTPPNPTHWREMMSEYAIAQVLDELTKAQAAFSEAETRYKAASSDKTAAINRLNEAQAAFDKAAEAVRNDAPWDTNWYRRKNKGETCEAA